MIIRTFLTNWFSFIGITRQIFTAELHTVRHVAPQHGDRIVITNYCDVTLPYVLFLVCLIYSHRQACLERIKSQQCTDLSSRVYCSLTTTFGKWKRWGYPSVCLNCTSRNSFKLVLNAFTPLLMKLSMKHMKVFATLTSISRKNDEFICFMLHWFTATNFLKLRERGSVKS